MVTEDYVSFETAKLLKEKGFDEKCFALYDPNKELIQCGIMLNNTQVERVKGSYSAPTLQMAMKWLREEYNVEISIEPHTRKANTLNYHFIYWDNSVFHNPYSEGYPEYHPFYGKTWISYEEATEAAIKYCLTNLI